MTEPWSLEEYAAYCRMTMEREVPTEQEILEIFREVQTQTEARVRAETWEAAAQIADRWANSVSCHYHDDNPCCHVRMGAAIAEKLREAGSKEQS